MSIITLSLLKLLYLTVMSRPSSLTKCMVNSDVEVESKYTHTDTHSHGGKTRFLKLDLQLNPSFLTY